MDEALEGTPMAEALIVGFLAETELHPGAGQGLGTIDQPVQREGGNGFPVVPGTSYKGAAKSAIVRTDPKHQLVCAFGTAEQAGTVAFGDIRLLLLPMRCSVSAYKWVTTPLLLERFRRDALRAGYKLPSPLQQMDFPGLAPDKVRTATPSQGLLYIEEMQFTNLGSVDSIQDWTSFIANLLPSEKPYNEITKRLETQLLIMHDDDFAWFCEHALPVRPHNKLDTDTKASENFWYEEYLPADTVLYAVNAARSSKSNDLRDFAKALGERKWLQFGGNETTGEGVCRVTVWNK